MKRDVSMPRVSVEDIQANHRNGKFATMLHECDHGWPNDRTLPRFVLSCENTSSINADGAYVAANVP
jgi:hypothetical protein